jgi:hypothetical protein
VAGPCRLLSAAAVPAGCVGAAAGGVGRQGAGLGAAGGGGRWNPSLH